ncbi:NUDIX hydrolase [Alkaliphilus serpentinus]|uniref:NUDIX domain-containing protein n=1 Tax=Alkaliphilus serpentinus TaxID=1482731 RepID=A0A833HNE6_9FIRM|nr:NUDIX domain-containing protein [Alkaliphilus serpentinus]KAB3529423.1 NUDIX domain-containing protein [Alkaliphilus serpentinus]
MLFNISLGIDNKPNDINNITIREAVRAVIIKDDRILMVYSNKGDYKFPGGGIKKEENHEETLRREVLEETGYTVIHVMDMLGVVTERKLDLYEQNTLFEMVSHYYLCRVDKEQSLQQLDEYEEELEMKPVWITIEECIYANEEELKKSNEYKNSWIHRETLILKFLRESSEIIASIHEDIVFGERIMDTNYLQRRGAYGVLINNEGKIAFIKVRDGYFLPGGGIEEGEDLRQCLKREFLEETGLKIEIIKFLGRASQYHLSRRHQYIKLIGYFYMVSLSHDTKLKKEADHQLLWMEVPDCISKLFLDNQGWAVSKLVEKAIKA